MEETLKNALCSLKSAGKNGFEGLITDLLSSITNQRFLLAKSGHQGGRDLQSNNTYVECKQYCNDKPPKDILGKITQANIDNPYLDLWLLVTTADISAQNSNDYENACTTLGITYNNLFATSNQKYLEALCIIEKDCLFEFFEKKAEYKKSKYPDLKFVKEYCNKASLQDYSSEKEKIKSSFLPANIGFSAFRKISHSYFSSALQSETSSMSKLRQKLNIEEDSTLFTDRESVYESLENWYREWNDTHQFAVINGEEGNGKSWAVAKWLASEKENNDAPPVIFLNSSDCSSNDLTELLAQQIKRLSSNHKDDHFWQEKTKKWFQVKCIIPKLILVIDGINEYHDANWWRLFISNYQSGYSGAVSLIITSRKNYWFNNFSNDKYLNFDQ